MNSRRKADIERFGYNGYPLYPSLDIRMYSDSTSGSHYFKVGTFLPFVRNGIEYGIVSYKSHFKLYKGYTSKEIRLLMDDFEKECAKLEKHYNLTNMDNPNTGESIEIELY